MIPRLPAVQENLETTIPSPVTHRDADCSGLPRSGTSVPNLYQREHHFWILARKLHREPGTVIHGFPAEQFFGLFLER